MYGYRADVLGEITRLPQSSLELAESLEQLRWLQNGYTVKVGITTQETIGIDTPADLQKAISLPAMTQTLDRITPPPVGAFPPLSLPRPDHYRLTNGIEVIACNQATKRCAASTSCSTAATMPRRCRERRRSPCSCSKRELPGRVPRR